MPIRSVSATRVSIGSPDHVGMPPIVVRGSPANRSICCGARRRAAIGFIWRGIDLFPILTAREILMRPKAGHSMMQNGCSVHAAARSQAL